MDLIDELKALSSKVPKQLDFIQTEEATKNAFVMPFISALGYNVFDPTEVTPELTADIGTKKGEKVDYAILKDGKPIILFECKWCQVDLDKEHKSQLYRYFSVTEARFGVLTNGVIYRFYTDLEAPNKMDSKPFLEFNLLDLKDSVVEDLKRFSKSFFSLDETLTAATELKYTREIKRILTEQLTEPTEEFIKFFASKIYSGKVTQTVKQQFAELTKKAVHQFINDRINERLKSALADTTPTSTVFQSATVTEEGEEVETKEAKKTDRDSRIVTTEDEIEGYHIVKTLLREIIDPNRVVMRDTISYCGILLDDNNRKPICRLHFNNPNRKQLGLFDLKIEEKVPINELNDIYQYADRLKKTVDLKMLAETTPATSTTSEEEKEAKRKDRESRIVTTEDEIEGHHIVKAILQETIDPSRVVMRDTISYCGILLDDNNRKPICRLHFNNPNRKQLGLFDDQKNEEKVPISELNEIYQYAERLKKTVNGYLNNR